MNPNVHYSLLRNMRDTDVSTAFEKSWAEFKEDFNKHNIVSDKDSFMFCPWVFGDPAGPRRSENCLGTDLLCFDFDDDSGWTIDDAKVVFKKYEYFGYTSFNHRKSGNDRFRIVLPLGQLISADEIALRRKAIYARFEGVDESCLSRTRAFYIPLCPEERQHLAEVWENNGELFSLSQFPKVQEPVYGEVKREPISDEKRRWILEHLKLCYVGHEPRWRNIGLAMCCEGYSVDDFADVSIGGLMREKSEVDCQRKWGQIQKDVARGVKVGVGHLINVLREFGHVPPSDFDEAADRGLDSIRALVAKHKEAVSADDQEIQERIRDRSKPEPILKPREALLIFDPKDEAVAPFPREKRVQLLRDRVLGVDAKITLLEAFEGFGKSYTADLLVERGKKVVFASSSNEQAEEQYENFIKRGVRAQVIRSRDYLLRTRFNVDVQTRMQTHPWAIEKSDEESTKEWIRQHLKWDAEKIEAIWLETAPPRPDFECFDVICTTIARVQGWGMAQFNMSWGVKDDGMQDRLIPQGAMIVPSGTYIIFDDPPKKYFTRLYALRDHERERFRDLEIDGTRVEHITRGDNEYLVKPRQFVLGWGLFRTKWMFTTTEVLNAHLIRNTYRDVHVPKLMPDEKMSAGEITVIKTPIVRSKNDGFLPPIVVRLQKEFAFEYIANGQGVRYNLENTKGQNALANADTLIEISVPHFQEVTRYVDELGWDPKEGRSVVELVLALDVLQQAIGRNSGYRWSDLDEGDRKKCLVLCEPRLFKRLLASTRYFIETSIDDPESHGGMKREYKDLLGGVCWFIRNLNVYVVRGLGNERDAFWYDVKAVVESMNAIRRKRFIGRLIKSLTAKMKVLVRQEDKNRVARWVGLAVGLQGD